MGQINSLLPPQEQLSPSLSPSLLQPPAYPEDDAYDQERWFYGSASLIVGVFLYGLLMACFAHYGNRNFNNNGEEDNNHHDIETGSTKLEEGRERLASLKTVAFEKKLLINGADRDEDDEDEVCSICLEILEEGEVCAMLPFCSHIYHDSCIQPWLFKDSHCPLCRLHIWDH